MTDGGYSDMEPPTMLTREERQAKLKAALAKLGPVRSRQEFMDNAKKVFKSSASARLKVPSDPSDPSKAWSPQAIFDIPT